MARPHSPPYLHQLLHVPTQGGPVGLGCHTRGPLHHQGRFEGGGWLGQGQRGTVSQCVALGWWAGVRGQFSPDSWDSGAPGRKKAHRSHPPCRRDPGKAGGGGGEGVRDPHLHPPAYSLHPAWIPTSSSSQSPSSLGTPRLLCPTEPPFCLHTPIPQSRNAIFSMRLFFFLESYLKL